MELLYVERDWNCTLRNVTGTVRCAESRTVLKDLKGDSRLLEERGRTTEEDGV